MHRVTFMLIDDQPWKAQGACAGVDPDLFFPAKGESSAAAKAVCAGCPVRGDCLEYALEHDEVFGVWGGVGQRERARMRRHRARQAPRPPQLRALVLADLEISGPVRNLNGYATSALHDRLGGDAVCSLSAVKGVVAQLEAAGLIVRQVNARYTYRIGLVDQAAGVAS